MNVIKRKVGNTTTVLQNNTEPQPSSGISLGTVLGTCIDGFLFGACCRLPEFSQDGDEASEEEEKEEESQLEENTEGKLDLTVNTEPVGVNEKPPILLSDLLSKSDLSDLDLNLDDITINPTEASHDDLKEPDVLDSLGENITTKLIKRGKTKNIFKAKNIIRFVVNV